MSANRRPPDHKRRGAPRARSGWGRLIRKPIVWAGGLVVAVITATLVNLLTGQLQKTVGDLSDKYGGGPAVKVLSVAVQRTAGQGGTYVFREKVDLTPTEFQSLNEAAHAGRGGDWLRHRGGIDPSPSSVQVVLQGNRSHQVRITQMRALRHCEAPATGTIFDSPPAGSDTTIKVGFDLDSSDPTAQYQSDTGEWLPGYFGNYTVSMNQGEQVVLHILSRTTTHYCEFRLGLDVLDGDTTVTQTIDNAGEPFTVSALLVQNGELVLSEYQAVYFGGVIDPSPTDAWVREDPKTAKEGET